MSLRQSGFSLIEVLVSLLIMTIGLLGAAAIQLNALKYTDSAKMSSQASFIAYDMMDRIRANPDGAYGLTSLDAAPSAGNLNAPVTQDLADFKVNLMTNMNAVSPTASIVKNGYVYTISIGWRDSRAAGVSKADKSVDTSDAANIRSFVLTSRVATDAVTK